MKVRAPHRWNLAPADAANVQRSLSLRVIRTGRPPRPRHVAGVDVGFERDGTVTRAAVVVLSFPDLTPLTCALARLTTRFPYVPGLLSFREIPAVLAALRRLEVTPDLILCDAHGFAHPRRFGLASHLGVICGLPTIGVAKSLLVGRHGNLARERGARVPLLDGDDTIGAVVRTRAGVAPVYVSVGHLLDLDAAVDYVLACAPRYRLPETTRWAHRLASAPVDQVRTLVRSIKPAAR